MSKKLFLIIILIGFSSTNYGLYAQTDSTQIIAQNKFYFSPSFHSVQIDGNVFFISLEYGGHLDFDLFQSQSNLCLGTRVSVEHYIKGDFGGKTFGSPFTNYNLYLRFSKTSEDLSFNFLGGISYFTTAQPDYFPSKGLPRIGFEIK